MYIHDVTTRRLRVGALVRRNTVAVYPLVSSPAVDVPVQCNAPRLLISRRTMKHVFIVFYSSEASF